MEINVQKKEEINVVALSGRLDTTNYGELEKKLFELFDMRCHYLWEEYREFLRRYYSLFGQKSRHSLENVR